LISKIAAVGPERAPLLVRCFDAMINPLPDEAALQPRRVFKRLPVIGQAAVAVAHGMGILA